jgi:hypothetical protein
MNWAQLRKVDEALRSVEYLTLRASTRRDDLTTKETASVRRGDDFRVCVGWDWFGLVFENRARSCEARSDVA